MSLPESMLERAIRERREALDELERLRESPIDVERLAIALRAWRGDYGEPLAVDLPDAADLAEAYRNAKKDPMPRSFDQYIAAPERDAR